MNFKSGMVIITVVLTLFNSGVSKNYKGAEYRTKDSFLYGRFEARYWPPAGSGALASFFTFHDFSSSSEWNEIDFEILGRYDHVVQTTSIGPGQKIRASHQWVDFNPHDDFHVYAFEWTPEYIAWFIDGQEVHRQEGDFIPDFQYPQKIMMNIWNQEYERWSGPWFDENLPLLAYYDYVSYAAYTPDSGDCGTDNNFTLLWKDEFDAFDSTRWEMATHTFSGNLCDFTPENILFQDGYLILCLTDPDHLKGVDVQPPTMLWVWALEDQVYIKFNEQPDSLSAVTLANYAIPGTRILNAQLLADGRTVKLTTEGLDAERTYNVVCLNVQDRAQPANRQTGQVKTIRLQKYLPFPILINVGGDTLGPYLGDQEWFPDRLYGYEDGYADTFDHPEISQTDQDSLFWSQRRELVHYRLRLPDGLYRVTLRICENEFQETGKRVYDILVNGRKVANRLDPFQTFGFRTAGAIVADSVMVNDGLLTIHFTARVGRTLLNAIEVEPIATQLSGRHSAAMPESILILKSYPNPFNQTTNLLIDLKKRGDVDIEIFTVQGQSVWQATLRNLAPGRHRLRWPAGGASGIYFVRVTLEGKISAMNKLILIR